MTFNLLPISKDSRFFADFFGVKKNSKQKRKRNKKKCFLKDLNLEFGRLPEISYDDSTISMINT